MKRQTKRRAATAGVLCAVIIGTVLSLIGRQGATPFPGAKVVLDDAGWKQRYQDGGFTKDYLWAGADTILYKQWDGISYHVVRRKIGVDGTAAPPEILPAKVQAWQFLHALSPDGKQLCMMEQSAQTGFKYLLLRTDGSGKPIEFGTPTKQFFWTPDSRFLYGTPISHGGPELVRCDAQTGELTDITPETAFSVELAGITPEGKLLGLQTPDNNPHIPHFIACLILDLRDGKLLAKGSRRALRKPSTLHSLSPDGKRLLWKEPDSEITLMDKIKGWMLRKYPESHPLVRWQVTDAGGGNPRSIGVTAFKQAEESEWEPEWTPDSKGVHFVYEKKLWRLDVP